MSEESAGSSDDSVPSIDDEFGRLLVASFNDQHSMPVHMLFNHWWSHAPDDVTAAYAEAFLTDVGPRLDSAGAQIAQPVEIVDLAESRQGTLGRAYHDWIVENELQATIATDYRVLHQLMADAGMLGNMPASMQQAVLRGFQVHDFEHVLTGYDSSGRGEIALQAFCLAQTRFPYFGMWMSVVTTQMTFADPSMITPMMDSIVDGWTNGRSSRNLAFEPWESMLDEPLEDLRVRYGVEQRARPGAVFSD